MNAEFILLLHPEPDTRQRVRDVLTEAGFRVLAVASDDEALEQLERLNFFPPDLLLAPLGDASEGSPTVERLRANPLTEKVAVVVLGTGDDEDRRQALRLGFQHVPPPYDGEELLLTARRAIDQNRDERLLKGSLAQLSVADLLQTLETTRRSGTVTFRDRGRTVRLWLRDGQVIDAETDAGVKGQDAVFAVAAWDEGTFEADFGPVSVPARISASTSFLLLEAMRRRDEAQRDESPPHAALPDPPPTPPRTIRAVHQGLTLLTVASSYAADHLERPLLGRRLEECRQRLLGAHPRLDDFTVGDDGSVGLVPDLEQLDEALLDEFVDAVASWLRTFFEQTEKTLPGRFSIRKLRALTEAVQEDLRDLGYYRALGLETEEES